MCISNNLYPEPRIELGQSALLGIDSVDAEGGAEHVLAVMLQIGVRQEAPLRGNAFLFAIPVNYDTGLPTDPLVPMDGSSNFMTDYARAVASAPDRDAVELDADLFEVAISARAKTLPAALSKISARKRPEMNMALYEQLDLLYPAFSFVALCFEERYERQAGCVVIKYRPFNSWRHIVYLPGLASVNGVLDSTDKQANHVLIASSNELGKSSDVRQVEFRDDGLVDRYPFFLNRVVGATTSGVMSQGDFYVKVDGLKQGILDCQKEPPPNWQSFPGWTMTKSYPCRIRSMAAESA